ncbi:flagellar basal body P-ring formation chaperone FlgA [Azomonas macrocytogenes]|nr:flagellar basal body P-ring formation chaperone FlgA [Azomonas macrocytogenes]
MNKKPTYFRRLSKKTTRTLVLLSVVHLTSHISNIQAMTLSAQLIDVTQEFLERAVEEYLRQGSIQGRHEIDVNRPDPRLRLAECDGPVGAKLESPAQPVGRVTVQIRCAGTNSWTVFVPARVRLYRKVVVAARPLQRNTVLGNLDVALAERDIGLLSQGYLIDLDQVLGSKLMRPLPIDQTLSPSALALAETVRKGDHVVINATSGGMNVRMMGEALAGGAPGQQIRVKNLSSGRMLKARVTGPGQVEVDI